MVVLVTKAALSPPQIGLTSFGGVSRVTSLGGERGLFVQSACCAVGDGGGAIRFGDTCAVLVSPVEKPCAITEPWNS